MLLKINRRRIIFALTAMAAILVLLIVEAFIQVTNNIHSADKTSDILLSQVSHIFMKNDRNERVLSESLKEDYIIRAKACAYAIEHNPQSEHSVEELEKIAELMNVDEIHLFDKNGTLYSGTVEKYYGLNVDDGDQVRFFKPMVQDKDLTLCQEMVPNTKEGKTMMYAMVWNESRSYMVQIGIEPKRLLTELKANSVKEVVDSMPVIDGVTIYITDISDGKILGCSDHAKINSTLAQIGIPQNPAKWNKHGTEIIERKAVRCVFQKYRNYAIGLTYEMKKINKGLFVNLAVVAVYLDVCFIILCITIINFMKILREKNKKVEGLNNSLQVKNNELICIQFKIIQFVAKVLGSHDLFTGHHVIHTQKYVEIIAKKMREMGLYTDVLTDRNIQLYASAAFLHDIGKVHVPDGILNKAGKFTPEEFKRMKCHTTEGKKLLQFLPPIEGGEFNKIAAQMANYHHEKWNGKGYPSGIAGKEIPLCARIMAAADVMDALISQRLYKDPMSMDQAIKIFEESRDVQFESCIVDAVLKCRAEIEEEDKRFKEQEKITNKEEVEWWQNYHNFAESRK